MNITQHKSKLYAKDHNTYVFKWKVNVKSIENPPIESMMEHIEDDNSFFWQYFVAGAQIHLTDKINGELALVNGTPATLHSIEITYEQQKEIEKKQEDLPYGSEIIIDEPLYVNVKIDKSLDGKKKFKKETTTAQHIEGIQH
jgi:hypothetical protein